jgi:prepilin-type processing-associated H-X9-DG protein
MARPELAKAFAAAGDTALQLLVLPTPELRRIVQEMYPQLPREIGSVPSSVLTRGIQWAALGADVSAKSGLHLVIQSEDAAAAGALRDMVARSYQVLGQKFPLKMLVPHYEQLVQALTPAVEGERLTLNLDLNTPGVSPLLLGTLAAKVTQAAGRGECVNHLKQIGIGMHNHHDARGSLPAVANFDTDGKPLLSWRVHLLPYLGEEEERLYREFHLKEPWDSEHNAKLIARMPAVYHCPNMKWNQEGKTTYLAPVGKGLILTGNAHGVLLKEITDGTSNTIMVVDASPVRAVIWTKPDDLVVDLKNPGAGLGGQHGNGFNVLLADGSVHFISSAVDKQTLKALFTIAGGEVASPF